MQFNIAYKKKKTEREKINFSDSTEKVSKKKKSFLPKTEGWFNKNQITDLHRRPNKKKEK